MTRLSFRFDASSRAVTIGAVALAASACAAIARVAGYNLVEDAAIALSVVAGVFLLVVLAKGDRKETTSESAEANVINKIATVCEAISKGNFEARIIDIKETGSLADALVGADAFIGLSVAKAVTPAMVQTMATDAIVCAMANPVPEIYPEEAKAGGAGLHGTPFVGKTRDGPVRRLTYSLPGPQSQW